MVKTQGTESSEPVLTPEEARLLLLISRPSLNAFQTELALSLLPKVQNWQSFTITAYRKFVLPMAYRNLKMLPDHGLPDDTVNLMRSLSLTFSTMTLHRLAAFDWFHTECVLPSDASYAYFKGPALASCFYPDPTFRFFRDVDLIVRQEHRLGLLRRAISQGCTVYGHASVDEKDVKLVSDAALEDFLYLKMVPYIVTPQGVEIEMHAEIDYHTSLFKTDALLRKSREAIIRNNPVKVIPDTEHFVFICYHHTRHLWSKLNWIADIDAFCNKPGFDREGALQLARELKIESTVKASLELHELASTGQHPSDLDQPTPGGDLLQVCLANLSGDLPLESQIRREMKQRASVLGFHWQRTPVPIWRLAWLRLRKINVSYSVFRSIPGGPQFRNLRFGCALALRLAVDGPRAVWQRLLQRGQFTHRP
ncbi:MAG: hypothetical protein EA339_04935 [Rhodobacteraceae bacterium]|nr:MAG: hypothetical protein EA339_04935 [Paracoccaceae bacterium]